MIEKEQIVIKNIMEDVVENKLPSLMESVGCCMCDYCRADVLTFALNKLPPRYVTSRIGNVYAQFRVLEAQNQIDIMTTILSGAEMVKNNPRHNPEANRDNK